MFGFFKRLREQRKELRETHEKLEHELSASEREKLYERRLELQKSDEIFTPWHILAAGLFTTSFAAFTTTVVSSSADLEGQGSDFSSVVIALAVAAAAIFTGSIVALILPRLSGASEDDGASSRGESAQSRMRREIELYFDQLKAGEDRPPWPSTTTLEPGEHLT